MPAVQASYEATEEWDGWRGSPELLAQVARGSVRATGRDGQETPGLIDIEVGGDHEIFSSPSDFTKNATREALRAFQSILIEARGETLGVAVVWRWRTSWASRIRSPADAEVLLKVVGTDEKAVNTAFASVRASVKRGSVSFWTLVASLLVIGALLWFAILASIYLGLYLLKVSVDPYDLQWRALDGGAVLVSLGVAFQILPALEVAPAGQSRLWRTTKFVVPIVVTLILSGVAKKLYG
jgi:hypothetical protein